MSHPFGDRLSQYLHRKNGLTQAKLAAGIIQEPSIISRMCRGQRLNGPQARERIVAIIDWLRQCGVLDTLDDANALLAAAGMSGLNVNNRSEAMLHQALGGHRQMRSAQAMESRTESESGHFFPTQTTRLIGRTGDAARARALLMRNGVRAVTFVGPPGVGKTRLALQVAHELAPEFADGAHFVALASISNPNMLASAIVQALPISSSEPDPLNRAKAFLQDKQLLLVLDNFEQLLGHNNESTSAPIVAGILEAAPTVKVLVTSRAALHINGEHLFEVKPLAEHDAVELFALRAEAVDPDFRSRLKQQHTITRICKRLDCLPLAIELAAVRTRLFGPEELYRRLASQLDILIVGSNDLALRQRTLRNTIDWSFSLLDRQEQLLFRRLGVFVGGSTLAAIQSVGGDSASVPVVDLMQSLVDKSLVQVSRTSEGETRFGMLEMLREYALEQLAKAHEESVSRNRHVQWFVGWVENLAPRLTAYESPRWLTLVDAELDNIRAALGWALESRQVDAGLRLSAVLGPYWQARGQSQEGWSWAKQFLRQPTGLQHSRARANTLKFSSWLLMDLGEVEEAERAIGEALTLFQEFDDAISIASVLADKGWVAFTQANFAHARSFCLESIAISRRNSDKRGLAWALMWLGGTERDQGQFERAATIFADIARIGRDLGDEMLIWGSVNSLAEVMLDTGDYDRASALYVEGLEIAERYGFIQLAGISRWGMGCVELACGDPAQAVVNLETSLLAARRSHDTGALCRVLPDIAYARHLQGDYEGAIGLLREGISLQHRCGRRLLIISSLERFAWVAADRQQHDRAATLAASATALRNQLGAAFPCWEIAMQESRLHAVKAALGPAQYATSRKAGQAFSFDEAVVYALNDFVP